MWCNNQQKFWYVEPRVSNEVKSSISLVCSFSLNIILTFKQVTTSIAPPLYYSSLFSAVKGAQTCASKVRGSLRSLVRPCSSFLSTSSCLSVFVSKPASPELGTSPQSAWLQLVPLLPLIQSPNLLITSSLTQHAACLATGRDARPTLCTSLVSLLMRSISCECM